MSARPAVDLACFDMAGTTVRDDGAVEAAFLEALGSLGVAGDDPRRAEMLDYVRETMGTSKITVFRALFGSEAEAQNANLAFESAYDHQIESGSITPIPGAEDTIRELRQAGVRVALLTGFSAATRDRLVAALGWGEIADLFVCPTDSIRGRPYPDMVLHAVLQLGLDDVRAVAVVGDTAADILTGLRAGARFSIGVLTGADDAARLAAAGATQVLRSVRDLTTLIGL
jgi:phosphonatase-like hydrolase